MKYIQCEYCHKQIDLKADNIADKINYYGECDCGAWFSLDIDAKSGKELSRKWFKPDNNK